jgi:hypothetical protein
MKSSILALILLIICTGTTCASTQKLDTKTCTPIDKSYRSMGEIIGGRNWTHYWPYILICPIKGPTGKAAISLIGLDESAADSKNDLLWSDGDRWNSVTSKGMYDDLPSAVVVDDRRRIIGVLPVELFPEDPRATDVSFSYWNENFPDQIRFRIFDPTVAAPVSPYCPPPLIWHLEKQKYIQESGNKYAACSK